MSVTIYKKNADTGDLKFVAEVEDTDDGPLALDAYLDEVPRNKVFEFTLLTPEGLVDVEVENEGEPVQPRRSIVVAGSAPAKKTPRKTGNRRAKAQPPQEVETDEEEAEETPAEPPKRPARKSGSTAKKSTGKAAAKPKGGAKPKGSPFKKSADDGE